MKTYSIFSYKKSGFALMSLLLILGCQNDDKDLQDVKYSKDPTVFIDTFSGGLDFAAFSNTDIFAFQVDNQVTYNNSSASMRIDVPNRNDAGIYAGGAFFTGVGRDLTGYTALTFWAKSSVAATIGEVGFGIDLGANTNPATIQKLKLSTVWKKYIIPIPNASKLKAERGLFYFAAGADGNGGNPEDGYSFWVDEVKFENIGTFAYPQPLINTGSNSTVALPVGATTSISGCSVTYTMLDGTKQVVISAPSYFNFISSNEEVATVDSHGVVKSVGSGQAKITATLGEVVANGSVTIKSVGTAPVPNKPAENVISIFSDKYSNVVVDFFNGFWSGSTTQTDDIIINGDNLKSYTALNYVGIQFNTPSVDATAMTTLHLDVLVPGNATQDFVIKIRDRGANGIIETDVNTGGPSGDDKEIAYTVTKANINGAAGNWIPIDIPLTGSIQNQKDNLALLVFVGNINFLLDNVYFYKN